MKLSDLREANIERGKYWQGSEKIDHKFHAIELAGEVGELMNALKKLERFMLGIAGNKGQTEKELWDNVVEELGDVIISTDLLANKLNVDLETAVIEKFNSKSREMDIQVFLNKE